nr:MAG TPA: hypothetical protein [Crassvirales sp.]
MKNNAYTYFDFIHYCYKIKQLVSLLGLEPKSFKHLI